MNPNSGISGSISTVSRFSRVKWGQTRQMEREVVFGRSMLGYDVKDS